MAMMRSLMEERVLIPEGSALQKTAWVYNGLEEIELKYAGRVWKFPFDTVTEVGVFQWKEYDEMSGNKIIYSLEGEAVARELVEKHDWDKAGLMVFLKKQTVTDPDGTVREIGLDEAQIERMKETCQEMGRRYRLAKIEDFRKGREMARAGRAGYRLHPSDKEIRWMKELNITDDLFNPSNTEAQTDDKIQRAIDAAVRPFAELFERMMAREDERKYSHPNLQGPRRLTRNGKLEPIEDWQKRRAEWQAGLDAVNKAEAEASDSVE